VNMTNEEIIREYREAKAPMKQIGILADENQCSKKNIVAILTAAGETVPPQFNAKPPEHAKKKDPEDGEAEYGPVLPAPASSVQMPDDRVNRAAVDAIARMLKESYEGDIGQEDSVWMFRERVHGVLSLVHELTG